jgi:carbamate kinase
VIVALGGNAIAAPGHADPESQERAVDHAARQIVDLVAVGYDVVVTHGNGPQVGNLLVKNDLARGVVPPVPLDWCVAQTQATLGFLLVTALEHALAKRHIERVVAAVVTRVRVDRDDPAWDAANKPIGRYLPEAGARERIERGEQWQPSGSKGWRRVVPSPQPQEILDTPAIELLVDAGALVVAAGGGGIPMALTRGAPHGVEAVLDKDRTAALLAEALGADILVIATDVDGVAIAYGSDQERWLRRTTPEELHALAAAGHFASGSMAPKVEAAVRFVGRTGGRAAIGPLDRILDATRGSAGTIVEPAVRAA